MSFSLSLCCSEVRRCLAFYFWQNILIKLQHARHTCNSRLDCPPTAKGGKRLQWRINWKTSRWPTPNWKIAFKVLSFNWASLKNSFRWLIIKFTPWNRGNLMRMTLKIVWGLSSSLSGKKSRALECGCMF